MQIRQDVRLLLAPMTADIQEYIGDDDVLVLSLKDKTAAGIYGPSRVRVNLSALARNKDAVWSGQDPQAVVKDCTTAVVLLTSIPEAEIMQLLQQVFQQMLGLGGNAAR